MTVVVCLWMIIKRERATSSASQRWRRRDVGGRVGRLQRHPYTPLFDAIYWLNIDLSRPPGPNTEEKLRRVHYDETDVMMTSQAHVRRRPSFWRVFLVQRNAVRSASCGNSVHPFVLAPGCLIHSRPMPCIEKLSCRREAARRSVSLKILLIYLRSFDNIPLSREWSV